MEATPQRPRPLPGRTVPPDHMLPSGANKVERITQHSKALVDDLTSWVDLKLKLTKLEVMETIQEQKGEVVAAVIPLVFFALAGFFSLVTIALGIGWLLGHPFWGFLILTALLGLIGFILMRMSDSIKRGVMKEQKAAVSTDHLQPTDGVASAAHP